MKIALKLSVSIPVAMTLILSGRVVEGVLLLVYSGVIINVIDATIRPRLIRNSIQLHPLIILFSVLGGIIMFGPLGILYGPLIAVFFTSLMDVYNKHYGQEEIITDEDDV